jgi:hypothetical protein
MDEHEAMRHWIETWKQERPELEAIRRIEIEELPWAVVCQTEATERRGTPITIFWLDLRLSVFIRGRT